LDLANSQANQVDELKTELDSSNETEVASSWTRTATMDSTSQSQTFADDIIGVSSGMEMANKKLMIQQLEEKKILLEEKIKEMEANEVDMQVFEFFVSRVCLTPEQFHSIFQYCLILIFCTEIVDRL
jgi:hypothetical protein